ncbi:hypothetical protein HO173_006414 [Letharia columbiana]|uniref:Uncharacterized protein n=1 Tax=Letharia columbiana TaxID=112416 RepID=A0A8H6FV13_9LECA|nr:uncharacterized protein HO173_006414 [Letharia columbiana]KAF6235220.1 hypothetical protein HO173_006414 [Letharia columbiana]
MRRQNTTRAEIPEGGQSVDGESGYRARLSVLGPGASKFRLISTHIHIVKCPPRSGIFQVSARRDPSHLDIVINCKRDDTFLTMTAKDIIRLLSHAPQEASA